MTPLADLSGALRGWSEIIAGKPDAIEHFRTDTAGIAMAVVTLVVAALLSVAAQSAGVGLPGLVQLLFGLVALAITIAIFAIAMSRALKFLHAEVPVATLLVPSLYALAFAFVLAIPLLLIGPNAGLVIIVALGLLIWRLGVVAGRMNPTVSIVFSAVCVIVLVVVPYALYMLLLLIPSA